MPDGFMIENDFGEKDTLEERVEKLNGQTGLAFRLEQWPQNPRRPRRRLYSLSYAFAGQKRGTGPMRKHELLHWTATFALGFRLGHASAEGAEAEPQRRGATGAPRGDEAPSPRPGTRMLALQPPSSDPMQQAEESVEKLKHRVRRDMAESARRGVEQAWKSLHGEVRYSLGLHADGTVTLTVCDDDGAASAELSDPMVEQLIEQLRGRNR